MEETRLRMHRDLVASGPRSPRLCVPCTSQLLPSQEGEPPYLALFQSCSEILSAAVIGKRERHCDFNMEEASRPLLSGAVYKGQSMLRISMHVQIWEKVDVV